MVLPLRLSVGIETKVLPTKACSTWILSIEVKVAKKPVEVIFCLCRQPTQYGSVYLGEAILRGNALAVYTYNASPKKQNDIGLEISTVTQSIDAQGQKQTVLDNLLYDPLDVSGGSTSAITCHN